MAITLVAYPPTADWIAYPQGADLSGGQTLSDATTAGLALVAASAEVATLEDASEAAALSLADASSGTTSGLGADAGTEALALGDALGETGTLGDALPAALALADSLSTASEGADGTSAALSLGSSLLEASATADAVSNALSLTDASAARGELQSEHADALSLQSGQADQADQADAAGAGALSLADAWTEEREAPGEDALADALLPGSALADQMTAVDAVMEALSLSVTLGETGTLGDALGADALGLSVTLGSSARIDTALSAQAFTLSDAWASEAAREDALVSALTLGSTSADGLDAVDGRAEALSLTLTASDPGADVGDPWDDALSLELVPVEVIDGGNGWAAALALGSAWDDGALQLQTVEIPSTHRRDGGGGTNVRYAPGGGTNTRRAPGASTRRRAPQ